MTSIFRNDIEQAIEGTLYNALCGSISGSVNVEYCRGIIGQSKSLSLVFGIDWQIIKEKVVSRLEDRELQALIESSLFPLIGT